MGMFGTGSKARGAVGTAALSQLACVQSTHRRGYFHERALVGEAGTSKHHHHAALVQTLLLPQHEPCTPSDVPLCRRRTNLLVRLQGDRMLFCSKSWP